MIHSDENVKSPNGTSIDKVTRYGWTVKDSPGKFQMIPKEQLIVDHSYQRTATRDKVRNIQAAFSWVAFCCLTVAFRTGRYYVIDGQHRALATLSRSDIRDLPCMVFESLSIEQEAQGFVTIQECRKPMASIDSFRAKLIAGDEDALYIDRVLRYNNIRVVTHTSAPRDLASVAACFGMVRESKSDFERAASIVSELCRDCTIHHILFQGMYYLSRHLDTPLTDVRLRKRIRSVGAAGLITAANKAVAYHDAGGLAIWSKGMLDAINSGLRHRFSFKGDAE